MKEIIIKVITNIIKVKWEMGVRILYKKYDIGFVSAKIDGEKAKLRKYKPDIMIPPIP
jgi:hypothetical protein